MIKGKLITKGEWEEIGMGALFILFLPVIIPFTLVMTILFFLIKIGIWLEYKET